MIQRPLKTTCFNHIKIDEVENEICRAHHPRLPHPRGTFPHTKTSLRRNLPNIRHQCWHIFPRPTRYIRARLRQFTFSVKSWSKILTRLFKAYGRNLAHFNQLCTCLTDTINIVLAIINNIINISTRVHYFVNNSF